MKPPEATRTSQNVWSLNASTWRNELKIVQAKQKLRESMKTP
jgi:hypothetical protein